MGAPNWPPTMMLSLPSPLVSHQSAPTKQVRVQNFTHTSNLQVLGIRHLVATLLIAFCDIIKMLHDCYILKIL